MLSPRFDQRDLHAVGRGFVPNHPAAIRDGRTLGFSVKMVLDLNISRVGGDPLGKNQDPVRRVRFEESAPLPSTQDTQARERCKFLRRECDGARHHFVDEAEGQIRDDVFDEGLGSGNSQEILDRRIEPPVVDVAGPERVGVRKTRHQGKDQLAVAATWIPDCSLKLLMFQQAERNVRWGRIEICWIARHAATLARRLGPDDLRLDQAGLRSGAIEHVRRRWLRRVRREAGPGSRMQS